MTNSKSSLTMRYFAFAAATIASLSGAPSVFAQDKELGVLFAVGDIAGCDSSTSTRAKATAAALVAQIKRVRDVDKNFPIGVLILGDLAYGKRGEPGGKKADFECFESSWANDVKAALADPLKSMLPVPGNHDLETAAGKWLYKSFATNEWIGDGKPGDDKGYYTLQFPEGATGAWRLFALNSQIAHRVGSDQHDWFIDSFPKSTERCVLAFWHAPVFSSGHHGHDESDASDNLKPEKQGQMNAIYDILSTSGATVVVNGHDHNYEELGPHDATGKADPAGIRAFVVGTGGKRLYARYTELWPFSVHYDTENYGVLKISLFQDHYSWGFASTASPDTLIHEGKADCRRNIHHRP